MTSLAQTNRISLMVNLAINAILRWQDPGSEPWYERVLWVDSEQIASVILDTGRGLPIWRRREDIDSAFARAEVVFEAKDRWMPPPDGELIGPSRDFVAEDKRRRRQVLRDEAWKVIGQMVDPPNAEILIEKTRAIMVRACVERTGRSEKVIYGFLRKYWQFGQTKNSLLPKFHLCGGRGRQREPGEKKRGRPRKNPEITGVNLTDDTKRYFALGFKKYYQNSKKTPLLSTFNKVLKEYFNCGYEYPNGVPVPILRGPDELPTYGEFRYWVQTSTDLVATTAAREGPRRNALRYRALTGGGSTPRSFGPGALYQIDSTIADIYLLSSIRKGQLAGRPILYLVIDVWTRMIVGYHLTFDASSYLCASLALENAACDKVAHCADLDITILEEEWPSHHLPAQVVADRGELKGEKANAWTDNLNIRLDNTPPYRADFKGIVERSFRLSNDHIIRWLPGHVEKEAERGDRDIRLDARFTLEDFRWLVVKWILYHNRSLQRNYPLTEFQIDAEILPIPCKLWEWGVAAGSPHLKSRSSESLRLALLPGDTASVRSTGIFFRGLTYSNERAVTENWFGRARIVGRKSIDVAYDPRHAGVLYLRPRDGGEIESCSLVEKDRRFENCSWWEVAGHFAQLKAKFGEAEHGQKQRDIELDATIDHVLKKTKEIRVEGRSKRAKVSNILETRRIEQSAEHLAARQEYGIQQDETGDKVISLPSARPEPSTDTVMSSTEVGGYVPPVSNIHLFKKPRKPSTESTEEPSTNETP